MELTALLGNETIQQRLRNAQAKGQLSHCYLLCGPTGSGKHTLARYITAMMECTGAQKPCGRCPQCHKILTGAHPDVITVDEPDKVTIPVKLVREACADLYVRPNEGQKKIYVFPRAQALNPQGQNALLKCIEEPPPYGAFLLLCEHAEQLLPTIRSRCVELALAPLPEALQARCFFAFGSAEEHFKYRPAVMAAYPKGQFPVFEGYDHMQYQIRDPEGFAAMLISVMETGKLPELPVLRREEP